jgi:hypothetical protein
VKKSVMLIGAGLSAVSLIFAGPAAAAGHGGASGRSGAGASGVDGRPIGSVDWSQAAVEAGIVGALEGGLDFGGQAFAPDVVNANSGVANTVNGLNAAIGATRMR